MTENTRCKNIMVAVVIMPFGLWMSVDLWQWSKCYCCFSCQITCSVPQQALSLYPQPYGTQPVLTPLHWSQDWYFQLFHSLARSSPEIEPHSVDFDPESKYNKLLSITLQLLVKPEPLVVCWYFFLQVHLQCSSLVCSHWIHQTLLLIHHVASTDTLSKIKKMNQ